MTREAYTDMNIIRLRILGSIENDVSTTPNKQKSPVLKFFEKLSSKDRNGPEVMLAV